MKSRMSSKARERKLSKAFENVRKNNFRTNFPRSVSLLAEFDRNGSK